MHTRRVSLLGSPWHKQSDISQHTTRIRDTLPPVYRYGYPPRQKTRLGTNDRLFRHDSINLLLLTFAKPWLWFGVTLITWVDYRLTLQRYGIAITSHGTIYETVQPNVNPILRATTLCVDDSLARCCEATS